uniref:Acetylglutamate kinase n=1 Tax=Galdieria yellowstonensis TaxID=3028027 RepID=A0A9Y1I308_9RHOD|nr:acetylglutamate kinase [Galdieria yellowstonensis]
MIISINFTKYKKQNNMNNIHFNINQSVDNLNRVQILSEALPYIQKFAGSTIVIKYGGSIMTNSKLKESIVNDIILLSHVGIKPILIHGGGPEINSWLDKLNIKSKFKNGIRITDSNTIEIVEMVLAGKINKEIVSLINKQGSYAVGLTGKDGKLIQCESEKDIEIGFVGRIKHINTNIIKTIINAGYIPVIASIGSDLEGKSYNINADTVAGEIAVSINAEKLILLTNTAGILNDVNNNETLIRLLNIEDIKSLITERKISGGMIPKVNCCVRALSKGVPAAHIIDGRVFHALLLEIFTDQGIGSMLINSSNQ